MLRVEAMNGEFARPATTKEISKMVDKLKLALEDGSIGLSTGLAYPAANDAPTSEIVELAKILPEFDGIFTTHMRNEACLLYTSPSPRDRQKSRMPSSA